MHDRDPARDHGNSRGRTIAALCVITLGFGLGFTPSAIAPAHATVVSATDANGLEYAADDADVAAGAVVTAYTGVSTSVTIPSTIEIGDITYDVTAIGDAALLDRGLTAVTFEAPSNVATIGADAFRYNSLVALAIPSSVVSIERCAFASNRVPVVTFDAPSNVDSIGECAFWGNGMESVSIPTSVTVIGSEAFAENDFATIDFGVPSSLREIGHGAFSEHPGHRSSDNRVSELTIPRSVVVIDDDAFFGSDIAQLAFDKPSSVTSIGEYAFAQNSFTTLEIPASLSTVGHHAFSTGDIHAISFEAPSSLEVVSASMFSFNPLEEVSIADSVTTISGSAFAYSGLTQVIIPGSVTSIGSNAFYSNNLTSVSIPESVRSIGFGAFDRNLELRDVYFHGARSSGSIGKPFGPAGPVTFHFPCGAAGFGYPLTADGHQTSTACEISFSPNGGAGTMSTEIIGTGDRLPASNFTRDDFHFVGWATAADGTGLRLSDEQASGFITNTVLHAQWTPATARECVTYVVSDGEAVVADYDPSCGGPEVLIPASTVLGGVSYPVTGIGPGAFEGDEITSVAIPNGVTWLGERALYGNSLSTVSIPATVMAIGDGALDGNSGLELISFAGGAPLHMGSVDSGQPLGFATATVRYRAGAPGFTHPLWLGYDTTAIHELRFDGIWGYGAMYPVTLTTGDAIPMSSLARSTYRFAGWNAEADGSGTPVGNGAPSPFAADTTLHAQWVPDSEPPVLSSAGLVLGASLIPCDGGSVQAPVASTTPSLTVVSSDPDSVSLRTVYTLADADGVVLWTSSEYLASSGQRTFARPPTGLLQHEGVYRWRAQSYDSRMVYSEYSPWCEFTVDIRKPSPPSITPIDDGALAVYEADTVAGGVGLTGAFELDAGDSSDAIRFRYSFVADSMSDSIAVGADGTARITYTPESTGIVRLYVAAVDAAGNLSDRVTYVMRVGVVRTVTFSANQGTGTMEPVARSTPGALPQNTFIRPGYSFTGWNTAANGTGVAVPNGEEWAFTSTVTLYAQWAMNEIASIAIQGPSAVDAQSTETYLVEGFDEFADSLGDVTNDVTLSGPSLTVDGAAVTFDADPATAPGSVSTRTLTATLDSAPSITDTLEVEVRTPERNMDLLPDRIAGSDRYSTGASIVGVWDEYFDADLVIVATGENYPDALAAAAAAAHLDAPLILTSRSSLPASVKSRLDALRPDRIIVIGSSGAISNNVVAALRTVSSSPTVSRLQGADRYATAREIVKYAFEVDGNGDGAEVRDIHTVVISTGRNFPDALSAAPAAASVGGAVILVDGAARSIPTETMRLIRDLDPQQVVIAGAASAVSTRIESQLRASFGTSTVKRIAGADRFATAVAITDHFFDNSDAVFYAVGTNFPDALAGAALAGALDAPLIVTPKTCVSSATKRLVDQLQPSTSVLLGASSIISSKVARLSVC